MFQYNRNTLQKTNNFTKPPNEKAHQPEATMAAKPTSKAKKEIHMGQFIVQGTDNLLTATRAISKLLLSQRTGLKEARYKIGGKTIVIKPRTLN